MTEQEPLDAGPLADVPGHDLLFLLQAFVTESTRYGEKVRRTHHLSRTDVHALGVIVEGHRHGRGTTVSALAEHLVLTLPSTTATVDRLVAHGYVVRRTNADDRRRVTLEPTPSAGEIGREMFRPMSRELLSVIATLTPEQHDFLRATVPELTAAVGRAMPD